MTGISDPVQALGMCLVQSSGYAQHHGHGLVRVTGLEYPGREHWAVLVGDIDEGAMVIDLTARQFSLRVPARYEIDLDTWLDDACEWLGDGLRYEVYPSPDTQSPPIYADVWVREDIDPDQYQREEAAGMAIKSTWAPIGEELLADALLQTEKESHYDMEQDEPDYEESA